jgi:hypothetical protein
MDDFHRGLCSGHNAIRNTTHKILRGGYYWLSIFLDAHMFLRLFQPFQLLMGQKNMETIHLYLVIVELPFQKWSIHFIREFKDNSNNGHNVDILTDKRQHVCACH